MYEALLKATPVSYTHLLLEEGVLCPGLDVLYQTMDDLAAAAQKQSTLLCENFLRGMNEFKLKDLILSLIHI